MKPSRQATRVLNARKVRRFIIEHPGSTVAEIRKGTHVNGYLMWLLARKLARWQRAAKGEPVRWYPVAMGVPEEGT